MKKVTKHYLSAEGIYLGSKEVPRWYTWFNAKSITIIIIILSILLGIGIIFGLNGMPHSHNYKVNATNALPF